jgi:hypothetical protein
VSEERLDLRPRPGADLADHRALLADEDLLLRLGLDEQEGAQELVVELVDLDGDRVRHLVARQLERLLPDQLDDALLARLVGRELAREMRLPLRQEVDEVGPELVDAVLGLRAHRMEGVEVAELGGTLHLRDDVARLEVVDLVHRDDHRLAEPVDAAGDETVAAADPVACGEDEEHDVDVLEGGVDGLLHALGELVHRLLEAGQVDEHELPVLVVRDPEHPSPRRVRDLRGDRDLLADEGVDERGLADVRPSRDGDEAGLHESGKLQPSGRSSSAR